MSGTSFHCELAWLGGAAAERDVLIEVDAGRIATVTTGVLAPPGATRLAGLTLPGFANSHSHAFHRVLRGRAQAGRGSFWSWRNQMYEVATRLDPDSYFELARAVYGEMVLAGVTCVGEFHYLHHDPRGLAYNDPNAMTLALLAAAQEVGIRITVLDTCYLHGGIGVEPNAVQRRFSDGSTEAWAERVGSLLPHDSPGVRVGAAIHSVRTVDPASIETIATWAAEHDVPLHAHVSEQLAENDQCQAAYGMSPTALFAQHHALGERFTAVHATHVSADDALLLGSARSSVCICPTTERDLADGIGPTLALRECGAILTLGTDSHAVIDPFEEARALELDQRLASLERGAHDAQSLLLAATENGHRSLGWPDAGRIAPGVRADLVAVRLDSVRTAGTLASHAIESVVFAATAADVHHVVVDGRSVVIAGQHRSLDVANELGRTVGRL